MVIVERPLIPSHHQTLKSGATKIHWAKQNLKGIGQDGEEININYKNRLGLLVIYGIIWYIDEITIVRSKLNLLYSFNINT